MMEVRSGIVVVWPERGVEETGDARTVAVAIGSRDARGGGRAVRTGVHAYRAHQRAGGVAGGRRADGHGDRLAGAARTRSGAQDPASVSERGSGRVGAGQAHRATTRGDPSLADRIAAGDRLGPTPGRGRQRVWTTRLLADYLARVTGHRTGIEAVRVHLHRLGYVCKRPP